MTDSQDVRPKFPEKFFKKIGLTVPKSKFYLEGKSSHQKQRQGESNSSINLDEQSSQNDLDRKSQKKSRQDMDKDEEEEENSSRVQSGDEERDVTNDNSDHEDDNPFAVFNESIDKEKGYYSDS